MKALSVNRNKETDCKHGLAAVCIPDDTAHNGLEGHVRSLSKGSPFPYYQLFVPEATHRDTIAGSNFTSQ